jgi:hypothetical protein
VANGVDAALNTTITQSDNKLKKQIGCVSLTVIIDQKNHIATKQVDQNPELKIVFSDSSAQLKNYPTAQS